MWSIMGSRSFLFDCTLKLFDLLLVVVFSLDVKDSLTRAL
jgi:hypothetical protein